MRMPEPRVQRQFEPEEEEDEELVQTKPLASQITPLVQRQSEEEEELPLQTKGESGGAARVTPQFAGQIDALRCGGQPLDVGTRKFFEPRFGQDFSQVRVHASHDAAHLAEAIKAQAFTVGKHIIFAQNRYQPSTDKGRRLLAHELTHVVQQRNRRTTGLVENHNASAIIQRRLVTFGKLPDVNALLGLLGPPAGLKLSMDHKNKQIKIDSLVTGFGMQSPTLFTRLLTIINHPNQHAVVIVARRQPDVFVGTFPPSKTRVQQIDIDYIIAIERKAPGNGVALAIHEIEENFQAYGVRQVPGVDRFRRAHKQAIALAENPVASELVLPGRRLAVAIWSHNHGKTRTYLLDYNTYYLLVKVNVILATRDLQVTDSRRLAKFKIISRTIDKYGSGSIAMPSMGAANIEFIAAVVAANRYSTVLVESFTDNRSSQSINLRVSQQRADSVRAALQAAGVGAIRIHAEGRGAINFIAPNDTAANRALNRRVVITVTRPII